MQCWLHNTKHIKKNGYVRNARILFPSNSSYLGLAKYPLRVLGPNNFVKYEIRGKIIAKCTRDGDSGNVVAAVRVASLNAFLIVVGCDWLIYFRFNRAGSIFWCIVFMLLYVSHPSTEICIGHKTLLSSRSSQSRHLYGSLYGTDAALWLRHTHEILFTEIHKRFGCCSGSGYFSEFTSRSWKIQ